MINPGMVLDERYEIIDTVGSGGMSIVYKAKDRKLQRFVAIKVLKPEFSSDMNFVSKFRAEAQSSASLAHPNIVNVYDVSEDQGYYFIVMELVEGITLKEYIANNGRLGMDEAINFSIQIASGLEAAHSNHVIHRDIKPQNIIVSKEGRIKVTDFGIAKAATSNTMSTTGMGSVHYISPEQARGAYSDERSDIYSLGITMYEMITGRVPFQGDTNVSIALMHIQNEIVPPRQYFPDIYSSLEKVVMKATQKKPERRYLTASALIADLRRVQANPSIDIVVAPRQAVNNSPTKRFSQEDLKAIKDGSAMKDASDIAYGNNINNANNVNGRPANPNMRAGQGNAPVNQGPRPNPNGQYNNDANYRRPNTNKINEILDDEDFPDDYYQPEDDTPVPVVANNTPRPKKNIKKVSDDYDDDYDNYNQNYVDDDDDDIEDADSNLEKAVKIAGVAVAVIIGIIVLVIVGKVMGWFNFGVKLPGDTEITSEDVTGDTEALTDEEEIALISVVGTSEEAAKKLLESKGFSNVRVEYENNDTTVEGYVIRQVPEEGTTIPASGEIVIYVSTGAELISVPDVVNYTNNDGTKILEDQGFKVTHSFEASDTVPKDSIISTDPVGGTQAPKGSKVNVVVSNGPDVKEVAMPNVEGISESAAISSLSALKLEVGNVTRENSDTVEKGVVIRQGISVGTPVKEGTKVDLVISDGKKEVKYVGTVSGSITVANPEAVSGAVSLVIECYLVIDGTPHTVYSTSMVGATGFPLSVSGKLENLATNNGSTSFMITALMHNEETGMDENVDVTSCFSGNLSATFTQQ